VFFGNSSKLTSRNVFRATPLVVAYVSARTVLADKGPLRRAKRRRALVRSARSGQTAYATSSSGGNTSFPGFVQNCRSATAAPDSTLEHNPYRSGEDSIAR
jgi:hypothetical protein